MLGIVGLVVCPLCAPFAWVMGSKAEKAVDASGGHLSGRGEATAGKILGIVTCALYAIGIVLLMLLSIGGLAIATGGGLATRVAGHLAALPLSALVFLNLLLLLGLYKSVATLVLGSKLHDSTIIEPAPAPVRAWPRLATWLSALGFRVANSALASRNRATARAHAALHGATLRPRRMARGVTNSLEGLAMGAAERAEGWLGAVGTRVEHAAHILVDRLAALAHCLPRWRHREPTSDPAFRP